MIEIEYIPLKSADGAVLGHARIQGGFVDVRLRKTGGGQALILTETGYFTGGANARIRAGGRVTAIALHENGTLRCCGFARGVKPEPTDLRRRIDALNASASPAQPKAPAKVAAFAPRPVPAPEPATRPAASEPSERTDVPAENATPKPDAAIRSQPPVAHASKLSAPDAQASAAPDAPVRRRAERNAPAHFARTPDVFHAAPEPVRETGAVREFPSAAETVSETLRRIQDRERAALIPPAAPQKERAPMEKQADAAPTAVDWVGDDAALTALLARAERVYARIRPSEYDGPSGASERGGMAPAPRKQTEINLADARDLPAPPASNAKPQDGGDTDGGVPAGSAKEAAAASRTHEKREQPLRDPVSDWVGTVDALLSTVKPSEIAVPNPFPHIFPEAQFVRRTDADGTETLMGSWMQHGNQNTVTAVRGEYSPLPPAHLVGFTRYIRSLQGGFWVKVEE